MGVDATLRLTIPQKLALDAAILFRAVTARSTGSTEATFKALARKGLVADDGPNTNGKTVWRVSEKGMRLGYELGLGLGMSTRLDKPMIFEDEMKAC